MMDLFEFGMGEYCTTVKRYPYRSAMVTGNYIRISRNSDVGKEIEKALAKCVSRDYCDNHTCYAITNSYTDRAPVYIMCTDDVIRIGSELLEKKW